MKAFVVKEPAATGTVVDDVPVPEPSDEQVLVKSIYTAINPVDTIMASTGMLVVQWPLVLGCDAAGVVVKAGAKANSPLGPLKVGDEVFGCTRLGDAPYATCQEYFLMDAAIATPKPSNISFAEAASVGVGLYTASLAVFDGLNIPIPEDPESLSSGNGEWAVVFGGASSVGKCGVQLLSAMGYKVIATCSPKHNELVKSIGATETLDYKLSQPELVEALTKLTSNKLTRIFDAVGSNREVVKEFYQHVEGTKYFSTTNIWPPHKSEEYNDAEIYPIQLAQIGRPYAAEVNAMISKMIPVMHHLVSTGKVKPSEYELIGSTGFESVAEAWAYQQTGKAGAKKVLVKLQDA